MLSRAYTKSRKSIKEGEQSKSGSIQDYEDCLVGFDGDLPLISCGSGTNRGVRATMKEILRSSVGVMGESRLGLTDKVVLLKGDLFAVKRFRKLRVRRSEFGKRVERLAHFSTLCEYLVPITAYLYAKRIKFVLCDYYPMGSLADLLAGGRRLGHTALNWKQRLKILLDIARAISFIHTECPPNERNMQMNVHGNIKPSNVMINIDFSARLSDHGFTQLAKHIEVSDDQCQQKPPPLLENFYSEDLSQKSDIFNFGLVIIDVVAGSRFPAGFRKRSLDEIKEGAIGHCFEFAVEGRERRRALQVLDIALACTNPLPEARPSIQQILLSLGNACHN